MMKSALAISALTLALSAPSWAQIAEGSEAGGGISDFASLGVAVLPDYTGSDEYRAIPFGAFRFSVGDVVVRSDGPGVALDLYKQDAVTAGVYARWSGGRDEVEDAVVALLPDVGSSVIAGGFVNVQVAQGVLNDFDRVVLGGRVGFDVLGEFSGAAWSGSASYATPLSRTSFFVLSAGVSGFSDDYADTLFSVDAPGSAASGLTVFEAEGGVQDVSLTGLVDIGVGDTWSVTGVLGYSHLLGDFADSPIVAERGDEAQLFAGIALGRRF